MAQAEITGPHDINFHHIKVSTILDFMKKCKFLCLHFTMYVTGVLHTKPQKSYHGLLTFDNFLLIITYHIWWQSWQTEVIVEV